MRFEVNSCLLYSSEGICKIEGIEKRDFFGEKKEYYLLTPIYHAGGRLFVPPDGPTGARLHLPASKKEAEEALKCALPGEWEENEGVRKTFFREIMDEGNLMSRMNAYLTLIAHEETLAALKKNLRAVDERFKKELERLLSEELAYALEGAPEEMLKLLHERSK